MDNELNRFIVDNPHINVIATNVDGYILGFNINTKKAYYQTRNYVNDTIEGMPDTYKEWANYLIDKLGYEVKTIDSKENYYEILESK